jgi:hypothetical protein
VNVAESTAFNFNVFQPFNTNNIFLANKQWLSGEVLGDFLSFSEQLYVPPLR